jgi:hypothetical protein
MVGLQEKLSKKGVNKIVGSKMKDPHSINTILVGEKSVRGYLEGDGRECVGEKKGGGNEGRGGCNNKKGCGKGDSVFREGEEEKGREEGGKKVGGSRGQEVEGVPKVHIGCITMVNFRVNVIKQR